MEKKNRFISFEVLLAILFIVAFFLPWLDWGLVKIIGWDIPDIQKKLTKVTNFFSRNKESLYSTYAVYLIPLFSILIILLWISLKQKTARFLLTITSLFGFIVSLLLFYKLPKAGSGVYLLCGSTIISILYLIFRPRKKKKEITVTKTEITIDNEETIIEESTEIIEESEDIPS